MVITKTGKQKQKRSKARQSKKRKGLQNITGQTAKQGKLFLYYNIFWNFGFQGDIEFQESQNTSLKVHVSGEDRDFERIRIEYDVLHEEDIVDIQVVS